MRARRVGQRKAQPWRVAQLCCWPAAPRSQGGCLVDPRRGLVQGEHSCIPPGMACIWIVQQSLHAAHTTPDPAAERQTYSKDIISWCCWSDTHCCVQGELRQYDSYHKRHKITYDDEVEEWLALPRFKVKILLPRAR